MTDAARKDYDPEYYNDLPRWSSYWFQVRNVLDQHPAEILEVGTGNKTVYRYLKAVHGTVTSLDIDPQREPDVLGSVLEMPFADNSFDTVLCAEVLEHLPFDQFERALSELRRVARKRIVLSLPHWGWTFHCSIRMPLIKELVLFFKLSGLVTHVPGVHFWEIGKRGYPVRRIRRIIARYCSAMTDFIDYRAPYHHFFLLKK